MHRPLHLRGISPWSGPTAGLDAVKRENLPSAGNRSSAIEPVFTPTELSRIEIQNNKGRIRGKIKKWESEGGRRKQEEKKLRENINNRKGNEKVEKRR
jgi:hypothetical protein